MSYAQRERIRQERVAERNARAAQDTVWRADKLCVAFEEAHRARHPDASVECMYRKGWYTVVSHGMISHYQAEDLKQQTRMLWAELHAQEIETNEE